MTLPIGIGGNEFVGRDVTLKEAVTEGLAEALGDKVGLTLDENVDFKLGLESDERELTSDVDDIGLTEEDAE